MICLGFRLFENTPIATKSPRIHPRMSSQKRGIVESAPSQVHGRARFDTLIRTPFPTEGLRWAEDGLRNNSKPRMIATMDNAQLRPERTDFPLVTCQLHEIRIAGARNWPVRQGAAIVDDDLISNLQLTFLAGTISGTATEISQPGRTRLCCVSEFLGNLPLGLSVRIGCAILCALRSRSGTQNPLDPRVDWAGSARMNSRSGKSAEREIR